MYEEPGSASCVAHASTEEPRSASSGASSESLYALLDDSLVKVITMAGWPIWYTSGGGGASPKKKECYFAEATFAGSDQSGNDIGGRENGGRPRIAVMHASAGVFVLLSGLPTPQPDRCNTIRCCCIAECRRRCPVGRLRACMMCSTSVCRAMLWFLGHRRFAGGHLPPPRVCCASCVLV